MLRRNPPARAHEGEDHDAGKGELDAPVVTPEGEKTTKTGKPAAHGDKLVLLSSTAGSRPLAACRPTRTWVSLTKLVGRFGGSPAAPRSGRQGSAGRGA